MASIWTSAAQAAQQGFDESYYLGQKAALLTTQTGTTWTVDMVKASFASAGLQAYEHYQEYGFKEGLNPNSYFNNSYYDSSKATASGITESAFQTAWNNVNGGSQTSTYFHYLQYGYNESGVNPSATFNEAQYYTDKAALLTAQTGQTWTVADVQAAFASAGLTPITHYMLYGGTPNEPTPVPVNNVGTTYDLTTGLDTIPGTANNDTINAGEVGGLKTLTAGDNINGAGGTNTINVFDTAAAATNYAGFTMQNVQVLNATSDGTSMTFDLSGTTGLTDINSVNSTKAVTANYVSSLANVGVTNATAAAAMTVGYLDSVVAGTTDTVALTLNNSNTGIITLGSMTTGNSGIETVAITAAGAATTVAQLNTNATNLTFAGDQNLAITTALNTTVANIDASAATGGLNVNIGVGHANLTFTGGAGNDTLTVAPAVLNNVTFNGGAGNDAITFGAGSLNTSDTVIGGAGTDSLTATYAELAAVNAGATTHVSQVENINLSTAMAGAFNGKAWFADATAFNLNAGYVGGNTITIDSATQAVNVGGGANVGILTVADSATSATGDSASLGIYNTTTANVAFTTGELEIVNLTSGSATATAASGVTNTLTLSGGLGNVTTLNIAGGDNLTLTTAASNITTVSAAGALGDLNLNAVTYKVIGAVTDTGVSITTGSGADQITGTLGIDTISTGAGKDVVTASRGADTIDLGVDTVQDTVIYTNQNQSNTVNGVQTISHFVSGTDLLNIGGAGYTAFVGNGADYSASLSMLTKVAGQAVYEQDNNTLWVDVNGDGLLNGNDFAVKLTGTASLVAADLV